LTADNSGNRGALQYQIINDGQLIQTPHRALRVKAIHIKVEKTTSKESCQRIAQVYLSQAMTFPLSIKM